jgi:hypothetical protein
VEAVWRRCGLLFRMNAIQDALGGLGGRDLNGSKRDWTVGQTDGVSE